MRYALCLLRELVECLPCSLLNDHFLAVGTTGDRQRSRRVIIKHFSLTGLYYWRGV